MTSGAGPSRAVRNKQGGYALLMAIFLVATMIVLASAVMPSLLTQGRREHEQESIWRGNQYMRAIQLYYRKNGHYPQTIEDLTKGSVGVHFLRKAYTDPMNPEDGSWRFIYVSPTGQLIGSVRYHSLQEMALMLKMPGASQALPNAAAGANGQAPGQQGTGQVGGGQPGAGQPGTTQQGAGPGVGPQDTSQQGTGQQGTGQQGIGSQDAANAAAGFAPTQAPAQGGTSSQFASSSFSSSGFGTSQQSGSSPSGSSPFSSSQPVSIAPLEAVSGPVLGGSVIGVGGKVKRSSLIVYQGGKTYFEWEFIWNPLSVASVGGQSASGAAPGGAGGAIQPITPTGSNTPGSNATSPLGVPSESGIGGTSLGLPPATNTPQ